MRSIRNVHADTFASDLILPNYLLHPRLRKIRRITLTVAREIRDEFSASFTATLLKTVQYNRFPARRCLPQQEEAALVQARRHGAGLVVSRLNNWIGPTFAADMLFNGARRAELAPQDRSRCLVQFPKLRPLRHRGAVFHASRRRSAHGLDHPGKRSRLKLPYGIKDQLENFPNANDVLMPVIEMQQSQSAAPARLTKRERFMPEILNLNLFRQIFRRRGRGRKRVEYRSARRSRASVGGARDARRGPPHFPLRYRPRCLLPISFGRALKLKRWWRHARKPRQAS